MPQTVNNLYITQSRQLFYCNVKIKIPMHFNELLLDKAFDVLEATDLIYNSYQTGSHFFNINKHAGEWVEVDDNVIELLKTLILVSKLTNGTFDVTAMPLLKLWGFYHNENNLPSSTAIYETLKKIGSRNIEIKDNCVKILKGQEIITGSFIKAFAVDQVIKMLKEEGVSDGIVNAGGSTIYALNNNEHPYWGINIPDAFHETNSVARIALRNECFSFSAVKNHYKEINGKRYGHIINAATGYPSANLQCGIIAKDAFISDVLSSALFSCDAQNFNFLNEKLKAHFEFKSFLTDENGGILNNQFILNEEQLQ